MSHTVVRGIYSFSSTVFIWVASLLIVFIRSSQTLRHLANYRPNSSGTWDISSGPFCYGSDHHSIRWLLTLLIKVSYHQPEWLNGRYLRDLVCDYQWIYRIKMRLYHNQPARRGWYRFFTCKNGGINPRFQTPMGMLSHYSLKLPQYFLDSMDLETYYLRGAVSVHSFTANRESLTMVDFFIWWKIEIVPFPKRIHSSRNQSLLHDG